MGLFEIVALVALLGFVLLVVGFFARLLGMVVLVVGLLLLLGVLTVSMFSGLA